MAENNFNAINTRPMDVLPNFEAYKYSTLLNSAVQSQHYGLNNPQANGLPPEYVSSTSGGSSILDINSNYIAVPGVYPSALHYFNDAGVMNNNNNNANFPNQNFKFSTKHSPDSAAIAQERNMVVCSGVGIVGAASIVNTTPCQYSHTYGGASCLNRNRYMPYNHNRACAAAAVAMGITGRNVGGQFCNSKMAATLSTTASNVAIVPPLVYTSYQQFASNYPHFPSVMSHPATVSGTQIGLEAVNPLVMATYDQGASTALPGCSRYGFAAQPNPNQNFMQASAVVENDTAGQNTQPPTSYSTATTSAPSNSVAGSATNANTQSSSYSSVTNISQAVSLRLTNLDYTMDEEGLRKFLLAQLKPITPVVSLTFEDSNFATVTVPDSYFAKQVVANLHRKKIGHKRMVVSYTRDSSLTESNTLRCQVAGLLKDVPYNRLPMYKFRELFQSRFKTSISVLDLYTMRDICIINSDNNEEKFITLQPSLVNSLENSPLMEGLQHTVPYCTEHFKREQHKGWAEQEIEPLPNVFMAISEIQNLIYPLLKNHHGDIPVSSLLHCIEGQMKVKVQANDNGVNLEHLVCCIQGIKIQINNFGIKILGWFESDRRSGFVGVPPCSNNNTSACERGLYFKSADPLSQITREVIELVKMSPKATMKFSRFIPAYHNHFGKQCRVADYGYTKLIELFEALSSVVQIMGDGENRQITLTHRTQIRRFTSDLLRILRSSGNKSILLSELPQLFTKAQNRSFDVTDYGVCDINDILDGLVNSNVVVVSNVQNGKDIFISIPKRQQTITEISKTCVFAAEMVELFRNAPQYTILFQKFVRSYHYHFAYQCRLSDYGFLKLADLMEAIHGVVEMDRTNDEDRRIYLSPLMARRVFAEQCEELIRIATGSSKTSIKLDEVLKLHKKKYGYQIQPTILGVGKLKAAIDLLPYVEVFAEKSDTWIICHNEDPIFRTLCYRACKYLLANNSLKHRDASSTKAEKDGSTEQKRKLLSIDDFIIEFNNKHKENLNINTVKAMRYAIEVYTEDSKQCVRISKLMEFIINIVRLLEQQSVLLLSDIKTALNCTINMTFSFGHPSLFALLTAYPDIFLVNLGVSQDSSEVRLAPNCELATTQRNLNGNQKAVNHSLKINQSKSHPPRFARPALAECNGSNSHSNCNGPPLAKIRNVMTNENQNPMADFKNTNQINSSNIHNYYQQPFATFIPGPILPVQNVGQSLSSTYNSHSSSASYSLSHNSTLLNSSFLNMSNISNKENTFNGSFNLNKSFNSSGTPLSDVNSSLAGISSIPFSSSMELNSSNYNTSKLWDRGQDMGSFYQTNGTDFSLESSQRNENSGRNTGLPPLKIPKTTPHSPPTALIAQNSIYGIINSIQNCPPSTPMYDPPKPDSPPSHNVPFWIDPVWSHSTNLQLKNDLFDVKSLAGPQLNSVPMVLSPYTLSKIVNMKKAFSFEGLDRKIT